MSQPKGKNLQRALLHKVHLPNNRLFKKMAPGGNLNRALNHVSDVLADSQLKKQLQSISVHKQNEKL